MTYLIENREKLLLSNDFKKYCKKYCKKYWFDWKFEISVPNKREGLNIHAFSLITGKNVSKILAKVMLYEWKCRFDGKMRFRSMPVSV